MNVFRPYRGPVLPPKPPPRRTVPHISVLVLWTLATLLVLGTIGHNLYAG